MKTVLIDGVSYVPENHTKHKPTAAKRGELTVGALMARARIEQGLKPAELAAALGVTTQRVWQMEHDKTPDIRLSTARKIHECLGIPIEDLVFAKEVEGLKVKDLKVKDE